MIKFARILSALLAVVALTVGVIGLAGAVDAAARPVASATGHFVTAAEDVASAAASRARQLQDALPAGSQGRVTMGVGVGRDAQGGVRTVVGTSEPIETPGYFLTGNRYLVITSTTPKTCNTVDPRNSWMTFAGTSQLLPSQYARKITFTQKSSTPSPMSSHFA